MKYLCLAYGDQKKMEALSKEELDALFAGCKLHDEEMKKTGKYLQAYSLEWDATTIRPKDGKPVVTDGPFIESRELVGGLVVIEARDLNEAVRIASMHPAARLGEKIGWGIELRPIGTCEALA